MNVRIFPGNAETWPLFLIRCDKEASSPEAAGSYIGSINRKQSKNTERNIELLDSASFEVGDPWTFQLYEPINFFYV